MKRVCADAFHLPERELGIDQRRMDLILVFMPLGSRRAARLNSPTSPFRAAVEPSSVNGWRGAQRQDACAVIVCLGRV